MFRLRDGSGRTVGYMLLVSLLCIIAIFVLTRDAFGLRHVQLFSPNALRSHGRQNSHVNPAVHDPRGELKHKRVDAGSFIEVVVPGDTDSLAGTVATVNSVLRHTNHSVWFHLVVPESAVAHLRAWLREIPNDRLRYQILVFPEDLLKLTDHDVSSSARWRSVWMEGMASEVSAAQAVGRPALMIHRAADIAGLLAVPVLPHTFGAFLIDTHSASKHADPADKPLYALHVNMMNRFVRRRKVKGWRSTFSGAAFVADIAYWRAMHAHRQLVAWLKINRRQPIYGPAAGATATHAAMLLVFYGRVSPLPPGWHLKGLGLHESASFSEEFVRGSKLIHWSGRLKPWMPHAPFRKLWLQTSVPDPLRKHTA
ncbi:glycosyltransferase 8 domain-containing protein 1-like [Pollicipes pollicipes]|uniref:glycosyltransferase 8 domain-containing protein 1-like n=1 Tax=Pollicipes pollicipes TaxID=41117 RepID=UPI0018859916|nr:glycosyltransferase 8 domain-containing protein 1-like [Pollicipes pollicipes]